MSAETPTCLDLSLFFMSECKLYPQHCFNLEYEICALQCLAKELCPLHSQLLPKAVGRKEIYEELPEGFIVLLFITGFPSLVMAHTEEDDVYIRLYRY